MTVVATTKATCHICDTTQLGSICYECAGCHKWTCRKCMSGYDWLCDECSPAGVPAGGWGTKKGTK